ncbi:MAG: hypothetical protein ACRDZZ_13425 [Ilumatobacteraceae bacterium]
MDRPVAANAGAGIVVADVAATALFAATATFAAVDFSTAAQWVGAITAISLFAVGVFTFLWAYWSAVQRSRTSEISVAQLYLLLGPPIPSPVRRAMLLTLVAQLTIAVATTLARPDGPDGNPGSSLAVGFLVPMLGFGLNGLWAAAHGDFPPRAESHRDGGVTAAADEIGQNADHG